MSWRTHAMPMEEQHRRVAGAVLLVREVHGGHGGQRGRTQLMGWVPAASCGGPRTAGPCASRSRRRSPRSDRVARSEAVAVAVLEPVHGSPSTGSRSPSCPARCWSATTSPFSSVEPGCSGCRRTGRGRSTGHRPAATARWPWPGPRRTARTSSATASARREEEHDGHDHPGGEDGRGRRQQEPGVGSGAGTLTVYDVHPANVQSGAFGRTVCARRAIDHHFPTSLRGRSLWQGGSSGPVRIPGQAVVRALRHPRLARVRPSTRSTRRSRRPTASATRSWSRRRCRWAGAARPAASSSPPTPTRCASTPANILGMDIKGHIVEVDSGSRRRATSTRSTTRRSRSTAPRSSTSACSPRRAASRSRRSRARTPTRSPRSTSTRSTA